MIKCPKISFLVKHVLKPLILTFQDTPASLDGWDHDAGFWMPVDWNDPISWAAWTGRGQEEAWVRGEQARLNQINIHQI